ncbi:MAG: zinc-binding dehydrogenase [Phenylobacterium sp.]
MKALVLTEEGPQIREVERPEPRAGQVLVRVAANALNRADLGMAAGAMHGARGGAGTVLGMEWAGVVEAIGAEVSSLTPGQRVMGSSGGAFAEYLVAAADNLMPVPDANMSLETAACFPVGLRTMHNALVTAGELKAGQRVLIQGASSGVGLLGMQIAREMGAGLVLGSSTDAARRARLAEFGADAVIDTSQSDWPERVLEATDGEGVDLIVDQVSGPLVNGNLKATRVLGRIVNVGRLGGTKSEFNADLHALRRITYVGVTFRTRSAAEVAEINRRAAEDLWPALTEGRLSIPIDEVFAFDRALDALEKMRRNEHFGKIVLRH